MQRVWDQFLTERDRKVFGAAGYGGEAGFRDRPALLVIDINYDFVGDRPEDILSSIQRFANSCGEEGWRAMERLVPLLAAARRKGLPIFFTTTEQDHAFLDHTSWGAKNQRVGEWAGARSGVQGSAIPELIAPQEPDAVIRKKKPSAFFGTPLLQYLIELGVNQLLCCGTTTSGCVRASVIDAFSYNYRVAVVEDCTFDRGQASHAINLFDMSQKYADVVPSQRVLEYIDALPPGLYPRWRQTVEAART